MPRGRLGNVTIPAISRIQLPQEIKSSNLRELRNAVSGQDTAALGTIQQQLETFQPFDVEVNLHGFYAGHHFDGFLSGGTGEFYFSSIATNGVDVHDVSSEKLGGVFEKVAPGDWIDTKSLLLWPDTDGASQTTESLRGPRLVNLPSVVATPPVEWCSSTRRGTRAAPAAPLPAPGH